MPGSSKSTERSLRIVHVLRSPVGGLFRHVLDLAGEQIRQGHAVGLIVDSETGGPRADRVLADLEPALQLGLTRFAMRRDPHPSDAIGLLRTARLVAANRPDVLHGHGAKGALYARLCGLVPFAHRDLVRVYTPHGGSLHFAPGSLKGRLVLGTERLLSSRSDLILFESAFAADRFRAAVGTMPRLARVVLNGVTPPEFEPVVEREDAADLVFVGELRVLKGVDILLQAVARIAASTGRAPRTVLVGAGPDRALFEGMVASLGLGAAVTFAGPLPAREAFALGRVLVVPSKAESLPYIVLEAAGARRPMIATRVGGIPEIYGPHADALVPGDDVEALEGALGAMLARSPAQRALAASRLADHVRAHFSVARMVEGVMGGYREALAAKARGNRAAARPALLHTQRSGLQ